MARMTAQEAAEWGKTLDFPTVWMAIMKSEEKGEKLDERINLVTANIEKQGERLDERLNIVTANIDKLGERIDRVTANLDKQGERLDKRLDIVTANIDKLGERIDRVTANLEKQGERLDERINLVTANIEKQGERLDERLNIVTANIEKQGERLDIVTANIDKLGERIDRVTANVDKMSERVDRVTANVGGLNLSMGDLIETLFAPHLGDKFDAYNYNLKRMYRRVPIYDDSVRQRTDIDILLSNTTLCMAVEVKRWLETTDHVDQHIKRMQLIRQYPPAEVKGKKLLGAIVGAVVTPEAQEYAEKNGFFILELTGEDVHLLEPSKDFQPKEW